MDDEPVDPTAPANGIASQALSKEGNRNILALPQDYHYREQFEAALKKIGRLRLACSAHCEVPTLPVHNNGLKNTAAGRPGFPEWVYSGGPGSGVENGRGAGPRGQ